MLEEPLLLLGVGYMLLATVYLLQAREYIAERLQAGSRWLGEQILRCIDYVPEAGLDWKVEATAMRLSGTTERGQLGLQTVLAAFTLVIATMVVIIVLDRFDQSLGDPESSALNNSTQDVLSGFADMTSLIGPLLLIAIGVVVIGLIRRVS